ncbi:hypothetical protein PVAND_008412 [Polypedilum vanderplanki]|uniref:Uncharacterized protein n=1 Tax=Polypedilum vanderplanki TaxID=319348 RepID=A0A9J6CA45_POLVA|nr:hypothetical protein PVAND_008412 [Polypedilum vanderplanki]KAG5678769.1 hypothetical protein PVAND_008412 [Polypedilum vanderplanki]
MSSYRSYRPWNSSLPSYSSTSNYRSRYGTDSASSLSSSTSKYSSITPSSYRPSYSSTSGTYRASRAPAVSTTTSLTPTYTRTYSNLGKSSNNDEEKEKPKSYTRTYTSSLSKPKEEEEKEKARSYTRAYTSIGKTIENEKDRKEPSPPKRVSSRLSAKDLSAETKSRLSSAYSTTAKKEDKGPPITFNTRYKQVTSTRGRSRDPSPSANNDGTQTALQRISAARSRDPSPASSTISAYSRISSARSRDPSPVSKSYTDTAADKQQNLSRTFSNNLTVGNKSSDSLASKNLNRSLSSSLSAAREKLDKISSNLREKSRDPSPNRRPSITSITSSFPRSRDASPVSSDKYLLPSYRLTNGKEKSREPSPSIALNKPKLRESSPLNISNYRRPSREPSPAESLSKFNNSGFSNSSSYNKMFNKAPSSQVKSPEIALSYMTASESIAANAARSSRISFINRHSPQKEPSVEPVKPTPVNKITKIESDSESTETSSSDEESTDESSTESEEVKKPEPKIMIQVTTVTRATSPNPTTTPVSRTSRRIIEIAKTIEKVRERPLIAPPMIDKATQSDRMDDSTRYARYASTVRSPYSPFSPSPTSYSSRYTSGLTTTSRYSREPSELSNTETEKSESSQKSDKFNFALPKSKEGSPVKSPDTSRSSSNKSPSKICISKERNRTQSKSKTPILPQSPKAESPTKIASPNKDFRKSALNMGTAGDRQQRRSKSSSSENSSPTVEKTRQQFQNMLNGEQQQTQKRPSVERSPSLESDSSTESVEMASQIQPQHEMTKEEKITVKVEEAKNFLLKTLGNPAFLRKSPTPEESETACCDQSSSVVPETTENECSNISTTMNTTQVIEEQQPKQWWAIDDDTISNDNEVTITSNVGSTLQQDTNQIMNGFSEMTLNTNESDTTKRNWFKEFSLQRVDSGEKAWWCKSPENKMAPSENVAIAQINDNTNASNLWEQETQADISELQKDEEVDKNNYSLGDRASPEGLESHIDARKSPYDNINVNTQKATSNVHAYTMETDFNARPQLFISRHTNIDDLLGGSSVFSPTTLERPYLEMITPDKVRIHDSNSPPKIVYHKNKIAGENLSSDYQQVGALPQKVSQKSLINPHFRSP